MAQSVKLSDDLMKDIRQESELQSRSVAGQVAHWLRIGRAVESSGYFNHARINLALSGKLETTGLTDADKAVWLDSFTEKMGQASPEEETFFAGRRKLGQGVGLDTDGCLVHEKARTQE